MYICDNFCFRMADDKKNMAVELDVRIRQLLLLCDSLKKENKKLRLTDKEQNEQITQLSKELKQMKTKFDSLKMARTVTAASVDVDSAMQKLSRMVREIDKCIHLLE